MLFTIVTVTRNNLQGLQQTYSSLQHQTFHGFEWLVIDGASEDGTVDFLIPTEATFLSEPDTGIYDAMNKGLIHANGYYILFLNAGDALADENTLRRLASYIEEMQETPDFIYGDALESIPGEAPAYKPARPYAKSAYGMFTHHQAMLYRHDLVGDLRYDTDYKIAADYKFTLQVLARSKTIVYCPFPLCLFESGGLSQQRAAQGRNEQVSIRKELQIVSPVRNHLIAIAQQAIWTFRQACPGLYWKLKARQ